MMMVTIATIAAIVVVAVVAAIAILVAACRKDDWEDDPKPKRKSECDNCKWEFEDGDMEWFFGTYRKYWWKHCTDCMYWWREKQH